MVLFPSPVNIYVFPVVISAVCFRALVLASPEIRFQVDEETHDPIEVEAKKLRETNSMVEEFMLLANISVAKKILEEFPDCAMLRRHPTPPQGNFEPLVKAGQKLVRKLGCGGSVFAVAGLCDGRHISIYVDSISRFSFAS